MTSRGDTGGEEGLILGLTTATPRGSVALLLGDRLLASRSYEDEMRHAERLFDTVDQVLTEAHRTPSSLAAIACDVGPGSFTGVRVGVASAKGMALALGVPLVPVGSLEAMAMAAFDTTDPATSRMACVVDAKRQETFFVVYDRQLKPLCGPAHVAVGQTLAALGDIADDRTVGFCGRAARDLGLPRSRLVDTVACELPLAEWVARRGRQLMVREIPALAEVEPVYLRAPDAVPNLPKSVVDWTCDP